jgi:RND family efflux transporter MFP subunit
VAGLAIAAGVALTSVPGLGTSLGLGRFFGAKGSDILFARVGRGKLPVTVVERGNLESSSNLDVVNEVEGMTQIIKILPEGTPVHKGTDVKLLAGISSPSEIPDTGKDLACIALDQTQVLHFRVFDGDGKQVVDTDEKSLADKAEALNDLKQQLEPLWPVNDAADDEKDESDAAKQPAPAQRQPMRELYGSEKDRLVNAMIPIFGPVLKKWELVCELDSANLRDQLVNQEIATKRAEADLEQAKKTLEVAEIAVKEYVEGTFPQDEQSAEGQIKLAEADLIRAQDRLEWSDRMLAIGYVTQTQNQADKLALQKAQFTLRENQTKLEVLRKYTREKQIKELKANVEKARSDELAKKATRNLEMSKELKLRKQIEKCKMFAPGDGLIVYANEQNRFGSNQPLIEEGATVRERQRIFSLPDISQMRVNTKVHESMVDRVHSGLKGRIRVDAFPQQVLTGTVDTIQPLPDPNSFFSSDVKVYTTLVSIDNEHSGLRPGMTAQVEILVTQLDDVLSIPVQAVLEFKNKDYVYVATPNGPSKREIKLGISNDKLIEIKEGLAEGEQVALSPASLMTDQEKRDAFSTASKGKTGEWTADAVKAGDAPGAVPAGKGLADAKKKGGGGAEKGKRAGGGNPAMRELMQKLSDEDRTKLRSPDTSDADREAILKKAGATDTMIQQMQQMRQQYGGGGGGGFGGGPGGGRRGGQDGGPPQ